jgi:uncharacterized protein
MNLPLEKIEAVIRLLDEGYPVPFIARYRKDVTGNLDETQIREIEERLAEMRQLAERKQVILRTIESFGKLTPELDQKIREARTSKRLEDIYLPYKPKRETLASIAKSRGLEPLALEILEGKLNPEQLDVRVKDFVDPDKGVKNEADALLGARHILGEMFNEKVELRQRIRDMIQKSSKLVTKRILPEVSPPSEPEISKPSKKESTAAEPEAVNQIPSEETAASVETVSETSQEIPPTDEVKVEQTAEETAKFLMEDSNEIPKSEETAPSETVTIEAVSTEPASVEAVPLEITTAAAPESETAISETDSITTEFAAAMEAVKSELIPPKSRRAEKRKRKKKKTPQEEKVIAEQEKLYNDYFDFSSDLRKLQSYRVLAINRGEKAKVLKVKFDHDKAGIENTAFDLCVPKEHPLATFLKESVRDALQRLLLPSLERELRHDLTENAEQQAVLVFAKNLRNLLLQPPLNRKRVLAVDPGLRHGCKTVALDEFGNILAYETLYITGKGAKKAVVAAKMTDMIQKYKITAIAIGNGTGCREAEDFVTKLISEHFKGQEIGYIVVNEAGASIYSASAVAKEEFPNYDVMLRGAISIGRRIQDPLNELVKIEPGHLGVGMYQHDVKAKHLQESLEKVVESCVNHIGVDLNRASAAILRYVAGLNQLTAKRIYEYRQQNGPFRSREQLKNVAGLGDVTFMYAAGFLKISDGANPLDATWIHPESYDIARKILSKFGFSEDNLRLTGPLKQITETLKTVDAAQLAAELGVGVFAVQDIITQLGRPGRDPREELPAPIFKTGILHLEDLQVGAELMGTVLNVVDFGVFVDIGIHESGLIHISHLADHYIKDAHEVLAVGDIVKVWVVDVDKERKRISLSMLPPGTERKREHRELRGERRSPQNQDSRQDRPPRGPRPSDSPQGGSQQGSPQQKEPRHDTPRSEGSRGGGNPRTDRENRGAAAAKPASENRRTSPPGQRHGEDRRDSRSGKGDRRRTERFERSKSFEVTTPKNLKPITEEMKKGAAPLRSFSDLAQFFGRVAVPDPEEVKRKQKEAKKNKASADVAVREVVVKESASTESVPKTSEIFSAESQNGENNTTA